MKILPLLCISLFVSDGFAQENDKSDQLFFQDTSKGEIVLKRYSSMLERFRIRYAGRYPTTSRNNIITELQKNPVHYGYDSFRSGIKDLITEDNQYAEDETMRMQASKVVSVIVPYQRPDGQTIGSPLRQGETDIVAYMDLYVRENRSGTGKEFTKSPSGYYLTLTSESRVQRVPFDETFWVGSQSYLVAFRGQAGVVFDALTFEEFQTRIGSSQHIIGKPRVNGRAIPDNGGPESLLQFSRRQSYPNVYGVTRENLWKQFDPSQPEFALSDVQKGAAKLGLQTQVAKMSLSQLQQSGSPALLFLQDDGRIVTLAALDEDRAVVVDRGLTRNVERNVLEARYSGEALVPTKAVTQSAGIVATDAVRELQLPSLEAEVPQQFVIRNTGQTPVTLQLEYPLLGVTESKLSKDTLAPDETVTLDLKVKWRSILKAPTQNVLVSLQTSDPIVPRLQLAVLLVPPQAAGVK